MAGLCWQPLHRALIARSDAGDRLLWIVAPFIKRATLERLLGKVPRAEGCAVIARLSPADILAGVSDLSAYELLQELGIKTYANPRVHLKLFVFASDVAFSTSGNVTDRGLGYCAPEDANVEVGTEVTLSGADWVQLYRLMATSREVTPEIYARFATYLENQPPPPAHSKAPDLFGPSKQYTLASLPATETPALLLSLYLSFPSTPVAPELARCVYHDLGLFDIPPGLSRSEAENLLGVRFRDSSFVRAFVDHLKTNGSLRFGAATDWIQRNCEDVPLPYRWEIKTNTRILYNWLEHYFTEITWHRPHYSQVIVWGDDFPSGHQ